MASLIACKDGKEVIDIERTASFVYINNLEEDVTFSLRSIGSPDQNFTKTIKPKDSLSLTYGGTIPTPFSAYLGDTVDIGFNDMRKVSYFSTEQIGCCTFGTGVFDFFQYDGFDKNKLEITKVYHYSIDSVDVSNAKNK